MTVRGRGKPGRGKPLPYIVLVVAVLIGCARAPQGHFTDLEAARAAAAQRGVPLFVDFFSPT